jgi:formate-dependent nitrite reductase membrane component NrfD
MLGVKGPIAAASAHRILFGELAPVFWGVLIAAGLVLPLLFYAYTISKAQKPIQVKVRELDFSMESLPLAAVSTMEEAASSHSKSHSGASKIAVLLCDGAVMVGGLALRCIIVFAAIPVWSGMIG